MVQIVKWDDSFRVGIEQIDTQHQELIGMLGELHEAILEGKARDKQKDIINGLFDYMRDHFSAEEKYMAENGYYGLASHERQHRRFEQKIEEFRTALDNGEMSLPIRVVAFLVDWLINHIQKSDKKYAEAITAGDLGLK